MFMKQDRLTLQEVLESLKEALFRLNPKALYKNSVIFYTYLGAIASLLYFFVDLFYHKLSWLYFHIAFWLWFTVFVTNFSECLAELRGIKQVKSLGLSKNQNTAKLYKNGHIELISITSLKKGDRIICQKNDVIPIDGKVVEGIATVDESLVTGESAPVIRENCEDRNFVIAGSIIISDFIIIEVINELGSSFLDKIASLTASSKRQITSSELSLNFLLSALSTFYILAIVSYKLYAEFSVNRSQTQLDIPLTIPVLIAFFVSIVPTTIAALLNTVGISGMDRLIKKNIIAKSGRSIEAASDIDLFILDKTGTITYGNRVAVEFIASNNVDMSTLLKVAYLASISDDTIEGRSIVSLAKKLSESEFKDLDLSKTNSIAFSAKTRMSGIDILDNDGKTIMSLRKGAKDAIEEYVEKIGGKKEISLEENIKKITSNGGTPLLIAADKRILGVVFLKDTIKPDVKKRFELLRKMGVKTLMVTGDNPQTALTIAAEIGIDDFIAEASSEKKLELVLKGQQQGHFVAVAGDGINDAPALAQADVGIVMNNSALASKEAANMIDLDNDPLKLIEVIEISKQLLMTRGALTTFSLSNDISKYFAIIPALFGALYASANSTLGPIEVLNIMGLKTPQSALISAMIFNSLIILFLIPLSLRGVRYKSKDSTKILLRNLLVYGIGGLITPFIGIKIIDKVINFLGVI